MHKKEQNLLQNYPSATNVRVRFKFWQNAHVRAMCVRPKIECANVRACEAKNRRNSQFGYLINFKGHLSKYNFLSSEMNTIVSLKIKAKKFALLPRKKKDKKNFC